MVDSPNKYNTSLLLATLAGKALKCRLRNVICPNCRSISTPHCRVSRAKDTTLSSDGCRNNVFLFVFLNFLFVTVPLVPRREPRESRESREFRESREPVFKCWVESSKSSSFMAMVRVDVTAYRPELVEPLILLHRFCTSTISALARNEPVLEVETCNAVCITRSTGPWVCVLAHTTTCRRTCDNNSYISFSGTNKLPKARQGLPKVWRPVKKTKLLNNALASISRTVRVVVLLFRYSNNLCACKSQAKRVLRSTKPSLSGSSAVCVCNRCK